MLNKTKKYEIDFALIMLWIIQIYVIFSNNFIFTSKSRVGDRIGISTVEVFGKMYIYLIIISILHLFLLMLYFKDKYRVGFLINCLEAFSLCFVLFVSVIYADSVINSGNKLRISLSLGFFLYLFSGYFTIIKCNNFIKNRYLKFIITIIPFVFTFVLFNLGRLDNLSVMVEYNNRKQQFNIEMLKHFLMSTAVVISGILVGVPLGLLSYRNQKLGKFINTILNTAESIPTMALISLLMIPLAFLNNNISFLKEMGISGIGASPVFIALFLYALYHIVNTTYGGLSSIEKSYIEISKGMGMTNSQIFWKVQFPMILPTLISGIRVASISTIIGVTIGSYVGFGGLGMFILQGANGFAIDIIILVIIPILFVVFLIDFALSKLASIF